jgi:hypothetical protein
LLQDALYDVRGRKLALAFALGEHGDEGEKAAADEPLGEDASWSWSRRRSTHAS